MSLSFNLGRDIVKQANQNTKPKSGLVGRDEILNALDDALAESPIKPGDFAPDEKTVLTEEEFNRRKNRAVPEAHKARMRANAKTHRVVTGAPTYGPKSKTYPAGR